MGSKSEVSPPRSAVREFFSSLAGMITIGLAAGLVLCSPFFIYWQRSSPETRAVSPGAAPPQPPTPPAQVPIKTESKQQTTSVDQFLPTSERSTTTHNTESANDLAQSPNLSAREQIDLALKFRLLARPAEEEKVLRNPRSPEAKVIRALIIQEDSAELRASGMTTFDRSEAEKLATEVLPKLSADAESKPLSMYLLSCLYRSGLGVPKDLLQAFRLSSEAASNGEKAAYRGLSWAYCLGNGVEKDEAKSLEWARKAADAGDTEMMLRVSNGYEEGRVLKRSLAASMYYLEKAARAGNPEAMRRYSGHLNKFDLFTSEDTRKSMTEESVDWLVKAAEAGNQIAMSFLSMEYEGRMGGMGSRVRPDRKKAFEWSKKAAASGLPFAIACLSRLYRFGIGCKQNEEEADSLLEQAKRAAKGDEKMISLNEMQSRLSPFLPFEALASSPQSESSEPVADQSAREATPKPDRSPRRNEAQPRPMVSAMLVKLDGLRVTYYGPRDKNVPDRTMVNLDVDNVFSSPHESLSLWIFYDHRTPQRIPDSRTLSVGIDRYGPSYEYDQSDEATIKCGDALLGTKARCEREFKLDMTKETRCNESFYMDVTIKALKQALDSEQSIGIQIGTHPRTILSSTCRAKIKKFIEILQSGSYPEGTLNEETDKPKAPEFGKPLAVLPKQKVEALTVDLLDTTWEVSGTGNYIYIYGEVRNTSGVAIKALRMTALLEAQGARWCPQKMPTPPHAPLSRVTSPRSKSWHTPTPASIITISSSSPLARTSNTVRPGYHRCKEFARRRPTIRARPWRPP